MNKFSEKICPFCRTKFKENDDIVVCSACDMPHHKDCWIENQGCTTFGCLGTIKSSEDVSSIVNDIELDYDDLDIKDIIYCSRCGAPNDIKSNFCSTCGNRIINYKNSQNSMK